jgi:hypothetical protein
LILRLTALNEASNKRRHDYVTILLDKVRDCVIEVLDDCKAETLEEIPIAYKKPKDVLDYIGDTVDAGQLEAAL